MPKAIPINATVDTLSHRTRSLRLGAVGGHPDALDRIVATGIAESDRHAERITGKQAKAVVAAEYGFEKWRALVAHVGPQPAIAPELVEQFRTAVRNVDVPAVAKLFADSPLTRELVNLPLFGFDAPSLIPAVTRRAVELVDLLIDNGADPNAKSEWWAGGFSPLDSAADAMADHLVARGAKWEMNAAAKLGRIDVCREIADSDAGAIDARGGDGQTPLHVAKSVEICEFLLDLGAELDVPDIDHCGTAAQYSIKDAEKLRYLVDCGARPDIFVACALGDVDVARHVLDINPNALRSRIGKGEFVAPGEHIYSYSIGKTVRPLSMAADSGNAALIDYLARYASLKDVFLLACESADEAGANAILQRKPNLIAKLGKRDRALLPDCAWTNKPDAIRLMLDLGLDIDAKGGANGTALDRAAIKGNAEIVRLLLDNGASTMVVNDFGGTPFRACIWASENWRDPAGDYVACVEAFLFAGEPMPDGVQGSAEVIELLKQAK